MHISSWKNLKTAAVVSAGAVAFGVLGAAPAIATQPDPAAHAAGSHDRMDSAARGKVVSRIGINIRKRPSTSSAVIGSFPKGAIISLKCKVRSENVAGNNIWYKLENRPGWVAARYVLNLDHVRYCS